MKIRFDSPFWERMGKLYSLIMLNLLWIVFSIPIITVGPSTVALHRTMVHVINGNEVQLFAEFYQSFKQNFKRNMLAGLMVVGFGMLLLSSQNFYFEVGNQTSQMIYYFYLFVVLLFALFLVYVFPVLGTYEGSIIELFRTSLFLAIKHLPMSILMVVIDFLIIYACQMMIPLVLVGVSLIAFINIRCQAPQKDKNRKMFA